MSRKPPDQYRDLEQHGDLERHRADAVLLEVTSPDGERHTVAALADVPVGVLAHALARLLVDETTPATEGYELTVQEQGSAWPSDATLRTLRVLHGSAVELVRRTRPDT